MRQAVLAAAMVLGVATVAAAQDNPMVAAIKTQHAMVKGNLVKSAAKMSEVDYAFKPTPEVRSFGELVGHVANANYMICATAIGTGELVAMRRACCTNEAVPAPPGKATTSTATGEAGDARATARLIASSSSSRLRIGPAARPWRRQSAGSTSTGQPS